MQVLQMTQITVLFCGISRVYKGNQITFSFLSLSSESLDIVLRGPTGFSASPGPSAGLWTTRIPTRIRPKALLPDTVWQRSNVSLTVIQVSQVYQHTWSLGYNRYRITPTAYKIDIKSMVTLNIYFYFLNTLFHCSKCSRSSYFCLEPEKASSSKTDPLCLILWRS